MSDLWELHHPDMPTNTMKYWENLQLLEQKHASNMIIILSDIQLDKSHVLDKLKILFQTYEEIFSQQHRSHNMQQEDGNGDENEYNELKIASPTFVLLGSFITQSDILSYHGREIALNCWNNFSKLLIEYCPHLLCTSKFIFIPSNKDIYYTGGGGSSNAIPLFPISKLFTEIFVKQIYQHIMNHTGMNEIPTNIIFTSNPSRIHYCSQEIMIYREDIMRKMQKHAIFLNQSERSELDTSFIEEEEEEIDENNFRLPSKKVQYLINSMIDQGHLASLPLTMNISPIYWELDDTLRLFPLPNLVCYCDYIYFVDIYGCILSVYIVCVNIYIYIYIFDT